MFRLDDNGVYTWHHLFLLLSLESITPFLQEINFPVERYIGDIRQFSRTFVQRFFDIEADVFSGGKVSGIGASLFNDTYEELSKNLGQDVTDIFCNWGNQLRIDTPFERTLLKLWEQVFTKTVHTEEAGQLNLSEVLEQKSLVVEAVVLKFKTELQGIYDALDLLEQAPKSDWDLKAYRTYNLGDRRNIPSVQIKQSPLDYFEAVVTFVKIHTAVCKINSLISTSELEIMLDWVNGHVGAKLELPAKDIFDSCSLIRLP